MGRPAARGRDDRANPVLLACKHVRPFAVVARIGQKRLDGCTTRRLLKRWLEVRIVWSRPAPRFHSQDHVTLTVAENVGRGKTRVGGRLIACFTGSIASTDKVRTYVPRFKTGAVDSGERYVFAHHSMRRCRLDGFVQQQLNTP